MLPWHLAVKSRDLLYHVDDENLALFGGHEVAVDEPIVFSYSLTIKHSDKTWVTRMDQYLNYGLPVAHWESFAVSIAIMIGVSLVVCCMFASILNKDFRILNQLRTTYRERSQ